ncbi:hypothetical protein KLP40_13725 [Hymenobacter sp. NST-14]|uniref:hypothetical protein n=1 Tax=Hymenobacter piscis TaxID=2839984 RepID=UPI001C01D0BC|nr:hypothetical protein [Hymenobacter piscis]MBT9394227.1 hypothetical protein [Hymenobacter piscis]
MLTGYRSFPMRLLLVFIWALLPLAAAGQTSPAPEKLYETAFNYIRHDRQLRRMGLHLRDVAVFDSIVHQDLGVFNQDVSELWGYISYHQQHCLLDSLIRLDEATYHQPYFSPLTARLTANPGSSRGATVILFSQLDKNRLLAQVSDNQQGGPGLKNVISTFDQSVVYLFLFGPEGKIQRCYSHLVQFN